MLLTKLSLLANEYLPGKRIFFIYTHKNGYDRFSHGLKANTELSYWCFRALKKVFPRVTFLRLEGEKAKRIQRITKRDVVIGHPGDVYLEASRRTRKVISFSPWMGHEDRSLSKSTHSLPKEIEMDYYNRAQSVILLTSEYNQREYLDKPSNFWFPYFKSYPGRVRVVHQPIDMNLFQRIKVDYKTSNFLYIGHFGHMKGIDHAKKLVKDLGKKLTIFGSEGNRFNNLDKNQVASLAHLADFFIQPGMWEGQCVSILEAAARGFIPIVSPQTGYPYFHPYLLRYEDYDYNMKQLKALFALPEKEKKALGDFLYQQLRFDPRHSQWESLTNVLIDEVKCYY